MMSGIESTSDLQVALEKIASASRNEPGNQDEMFKLIKQISAISKSILPVPQDVQPKSTSDSITLEIFHVISKHLIGVLKHSVHGSDVIENRAKSVCVCLENLTLLSGSEYAKENFLDIVSHATYMMIQDNMEFVEDILENLDRVATAIISLINNAKGFALDMAEALFLCDALNMSQHEQTSMIANAILEKLSTELLTVADALKESAIKSSSHKLSNFLEVQSARSEDSVSTQNLLALASIVDSFLDLELSLNSGVATEIQKLKASSDRMRKSSLKHRLNDILRSSQEGSWSRSLTMYGEWDWQEILQDISGILANSIAEAFENFQTKELSPFRKMEQEETYLVEPVVSVSSEWQNGMHSPRKTISQFKDILSLVKSLLPYGKLGSQYKPLTSLLSCYVDECSKSLKTMKSYLSMMLNDFPEKLTASTLFCAIATCEDVILTVRFCSISISADVTAPFQGILQIYSDTIATIKSVVVQYLCSRIRNYILHDAESDHFSDPKEFADGERCSYSVANWRRFLDRILIDMDLTLSELSRNEVFSEIFLDSLTALKSRYLRCQPSYNRTKQFCFDIPFIIGTCERYLISNDEFQMLIFSADDHCHVISVCCLLHAIMIVVTAPLSILHESVKKMLPVNKTNSQRGDFKSVSSFKNETSVANCVTKLLSNEQSLLHYVLSDSFESVIGVHKAQEFRLHVYTFLASGFSLWSERFFDCALLSVNNDRDKLVKYCTQSAGDFKHQWQLVLFAKLSKILCQCLEASVSYLCHPCWSPFTKSLIDSLPASMRSSVSDMASRTDRTEDRLMASVILMILSIKQSLYLFPEWLVKFLAKVGSQSEIESEDQTTDVVMDIVLTATERLLCTPDICEELCQLSLTKDGVDALHAASSLMSRVRKIGYKPSDAGKVALQMLDSLQRELQVCLRLLPENELQHSEEQLLQECRLEVVDIKNNDEEAYDSLIYVNDLLKQHCTSLKLVHNQTSAILKSLQQFQPWNEMCDSALANIDFDTLAELVSHKWEARTGSAVTDEQIEHLEEILNTINQSS